MFPKKIFFLCKIAFSSTYHAKYIATFLIFILDFWISEWPQNKSHLLVYYSVHIVLSTNIFLSSEVFFLYQGINCYS